MGRPGVLLVDKPLGPTSRQLLDRLERQLGLGPLGHAGTLDPLASGLLVVLVGSARRLQQLLLASRKVYTGELRLGWVSHTLDSEGPVSPGPAPVPESLDLDEARARFLGEQQQVPPAHSAVHVGGRRAWQAARKGQEVAVPPRTVTLHELELERPDIDRVSFRVMCSAGTYVRSLARDLGVLWGCGAYLAALRRVAAGALSVEDARPPEDCGASDPWPLSRILAALPRLDVSEEEARQLAQGRPVAVRERDPGEGGFAWFEGEPFCRLKRLPEGLMRSDLRLFDPLAATGRDREA